MQKLNRFMFAFAFFAMALCTEPPGEYYIEITPNAEPDYYAVKVGDVAIFEVTAYEKGNGFDSPASIEGKIWWEYNKKLFEKVYSNKIDFQVKFHH